MRQEVELTSKAQRRKLPRMKGCSSNWTRDGVPGANPGQRVVQKAVVYTNAQRLRNEQQVRMLEAELRRRD